MKEEVLKVSQSSVAQALAADYFCIYYVNVKNGKFIEYSASPEYREFGLPSIGDDIIRFSHDNFDEIIFPEDRALFLETFTKENIVAALDHYGTFTMTFRLMFRNGTKYVHLKATRMIEEEGRHLVIGISSVDEQIRAKEDFERAHHASITYSRVAQALAGDYFSIYVVDPQNDHFVEYSANAQYEELGLEKEGYDFFEVSRRNMDRIIYPGDRDRFMGTFTKEKVMSILNRDGSFTMKYRLMFDEVPVYVSMKATLLDDKDGRHLIIGTNNIDAQMKREAQYRHQVAEARTNARNDFLANMSHDIRTPMNAIVGYTNIAGSNMDDPEKIKDALEKIGSSSHFLLSLINDILDISKIESGKMQLNCAPCNLNDIFRRIEDITQLQAMSKSLKITYNLDNVRHYLVNGDELRIEQILINIISNAIKYTPAGKEVDLIAEEMPEPLPEPGKHRYRFIIRDTGIGISEEYLPHIFESFTREESTKINRVQGTGLGLAITARIVELMGGTISVRSKFGEGSEFTVVLDLPSLEEEENAAGPQEEGIDLAGCRVLLVEDNEINAEIASMILQQYGVVTDRAANGQEGLEKVRVSGENQDTDFSTDQRSAGDGDAGAGAEKYDAVLMDIQMPVMNGYEATQAIRALTGKYYQTLPIIAMSANAYDEDVRDCLQSGMNAHIAKPFDPEDLVRLLQRYIREV